MSEIKKRLDAIREKAQQKAKAETVQKGKPNYKGRSPGKLFGSSGPHVTTGPVGRDSAGYSILKAAGFAAGILPEEACKEEIETHKKLKSLYAHYSGWGYQQKGFLVPTSTEHLPIAYGPDTMEPDSDKVKYVGELRQKMLASASNGADPDEIRWMTQKGLVRKAFGTLDDTGGGSLVGFPELGEVIELQRNKEIFTQAGAKEVTLPPNGRIMFPKQTGPSTAYMVGEASTITASQPTTGSLLLEAHKLAIRVQINNELFRFANPTAEALIRDDMAKVAALKLNSEMLEGTGGVRLKGLLTYDGTTAWSQGTDKIIYHTAKTVGTNGNTFEPEDVGLMEAKLPDAVDAPTSWVMRRLMFGALKNRRADAVTAADGKGPFVFDITRSAEEPRLDKLYGTKVVTSNLVSNTRDKGSATDLTYILLGYFPDWLIGRFGVMEFLANPWGDTAWANDQVELRGIQHVDAGPRHAASFVLCDDLILA